MRPSNAYQAGTEVADRFIASYAQHLVERAERSTTKAIGSYAVVTTPRVGSTYLCRCLEDTVALGWPLEWFNGRYIDAVLKTVNRSMSFEDYVDLITRGSVTDNGIFGVHFHVSQYAELRKKGGDLRKLGFTKIYWLERRDKIAQAYSCVKGQKTDLWSREAEIAAGHADGIVVEIAPDEVAKEIAVNRAHVELYKRDFSALVDREYFYEDLIQDAFEGVVRDVLADFRATPARACARGVTERQSKEHDRQACNALRGLLSGEYAVETSVA